MSHISVCSPFITSGLFPISATILIRVGRLLFNTCSINTIIAICKEGHLIFRKDDDALSVLLPITSSQRHANARNSCPSQSTNIS